MRKQLNTQVTAKERILKQTQYVPSYAPNQSGLLIEAINNAFGNSEELTTEIAIKIYNSLIDIVEKTRPLYENHVFSKSFHYRQFKPFTSAFAEQLDKIYDEIKIKLPNYCHNPLYDKSAKPFVQLSDKERILKQIRGIPFYASYQSGLLTKSINSAFEDSEELTTKIAIKIYDSLIAVVKQSQLQWGNLFTRTGFFNQTDGSLPKFFAKINKVYEEIKVKLPETYSNPLYDKSANQIEESSNNIIWRD